MAGLSKNILIVGAGAAGLTASIGASRAGAKVRVVEHKNEAGIKLSITGRGRGNFSNTDISPIHYHSKDPEFVKRVLDGFGADKLISFFKSLGVDHLVKYFDFNSMGYIYPLSLKASDLRDALFNEAKKEGVRFDFSAEASSLSDSFFNDFDAIILAAGGNSYPVTGSDGSIYHLIKRFSLPFNTFRPALCALYSKDEKLAFLKGSRIRTNVSLIIDDSLIESRFGEIQFNEHSISGIEVMNLSSFAGEALDKGKKVELLIDGHQYSVYRLSGFNRSQVSRGGLDIFYFDPTALRSLVNKKIYAAGEILDIDGECGGFNLHFAFSSGLRAGRMAAIND